MDKIRLGIVGCGGMGQSHLGIIKELPTHELTAACDNFEGNLKKVCETYGTKGFTDPAAMMDSGLVDAVLIATPHYFHVPVALEAIKRDIHVLCEKPLAVSANVARQAIAEHKKHPKVVFAMMHQMRADPKFKLVKKLLDQGEIGEIQRITWLVNNWFRTQAYYDSGTWRATWEGEGGGVLLNQCPHQLDLLWWLAGSPSKITAKVNLAKFHNIEVEDDVTAILEYPNGATGVFITSTGDLAGSNRLEITGDKGKIIIGDGSVEVHTSDISGKAFCHGSKQMWGTPSLTKAVYETQPAPGPKAVHMNFADAILNGAPVIAPGEQGVHAVDLGNAMIYSGLRKTESSYPADGDAFEKLLAELVEEARKNKKK